MSRVDELRALLAAATPGPWATKPGRYDGSPHVDPVADMWLTGNEWADAALIAAAPDALARLLDVADVAHRAGENGVDGLTYCGLCGYEVSHCNTNKPECWGTNLRTALARLEGTSWTIDREGAPQWQQPSQPTVSPATSTSPRRSYAPPPTRRTPTVRATSQPSPTPTTASPTAPASQSRPDPSTATPSRPSPTAGTGGTP